MSPHSLTRGCDGTDWTRKVHLWQALRFQVGSGLGLGLGLPGRGIWRQHQKQNRRHTHTGAAFIQVRCRRARRRKTTLPQPAPRQQPHPLPHSLQHTLPRASHRPALFPQMPRRLCSRQSNGTSSSYRRARLCNQRPLPHRRRHHLAHFRRKKCMPCSHLCSRTNRLQTTTLMLAEEETRRMLCSSGQPRRRRVKSYRSRTSRACALRKSSLRTHCRTRT